MRYALFALLTISMIQTHAQSSSSKSNELHPSWSPDGSWLCFQSNKNGSDDIFAMNISTQEIIKLTRNDSADTSPVWSISNNYIVFESQRSGNSDIYVIDWKSRSVTKVVADDYSEIHPTFIDDDIIVYSAFIDGNWQLFKTNLNGNKQQITFKPRDHLSPTFSNNINEIYFSISDRGKHQTDVEIMLMEISTGEVTAITKDSRVSSNASTQKDSNIIVFNTMRNGNWDIYKMSSDGSDQVAMTTNTGNENTGFAFSDLDGQPALSPNNKWIAYTSGSEGSFDICLIRTNGSQYKNLTQNWVKD